MISKHKEVLQVAGWFGGPVLLCMLTKWLYQLIAPQVLEGEFSFIHFLWPAFGGFWLGFVTVYLLTDEEDLHTRIKTIRSNIFSVALFSFFFLFIRRDRLVEYVPGPALVLVWCVILVGLCSIFHKWDVAQAGQGKPKL